METQGQSFGHTGGEHKIIGGERNPKIGRFPLIEGEKPLGVIARGRLQMNGMMGSPLGAVFVVFPDLGQSRRQGGLRHVSGASLVDHNGAETHVEEGHSHHSENRKRAHSDQQQNGPNGDSAPLPRTSSHGV